MVISCKKPCKRKRSTMLTVEQMVDIALGTPEIGAVNFNVLHALIHVIIQRLNIQKCLVEFKGYDSDRMEGIILTAKPGPILKLSEYMVDGTDGKPCPPKDKTGKEGEEGKEHGADDREEGEGREGREGGTGRKVICECTGKRKKPVDDDKTGDKERAEREKDSVEGEAKKGQERKGVVGAESGQEDCEEVEEPQPKRVREVKKPCPCRVNKEQGTILADESLKAVPSAYYESDGDVPCQTIVRVEPVAERCDSWRSRPALAHESMIKLEEKVAMLQDAFEALEQMPTNEELKKKAQGTGNASTPVKDLWQMYNLNKRVESCEGTIEKLASMIEDLVKETCNFREAMIVVAGAVDDIQCGEQTTINCGALLQGQKQMPSSGGGKKKTGRTGDNQAIMFKDCGGKPCEQTQKGDEPADKFSSIEKYRTGGDTVVRDPSIPSPAPPKQSVVMAVPSAARQSIAPGTSSSQRQIAAPRMSVVPRQSVALGQKHSVGQTMPSSGRPSVMMPPASRRESLVSAVAEEAGPIRSTDSSSTEREGMSEVEHKPPEVAERLQQEAPTPEATPRPRFEPSTYESDARGGGMPDSVGIGPEFFRMSVSEKFCVLKEFVDCLCHQIRLLTDSYPLKQISSKLCALVSMQKQVDNLEREWRDFLSNYEEGGGVSGFVQEFQKMKQNVEALNTSVAEIKSDKKEAESTIKVIAQETNYLKKVKADLEMVEDLLAEKADTSLVNRKVSHDQFDAACDDLTRGLDEALEKLLQQEVMWNEAMEELQATLDNKLDKVEIMPLKEFINKKLTCLQEKLRQLAQLRKVAEAAGAKSRVLRNLNCIACDGDVIMKMDNRAGYNSAPLPPSKTLRPMLTYELDQVRKAMKKGPQCRAANHVEEALMDAQKKEAGIPLTNADAVRNKISKFAHFCNRYCGGSHTITTPQQRVTRIGHFLTEFGPQAIALFNQEYMDCKSNQQQTEIVPSDADLRKPC